MAYFLAAQFLVSYLNIEGSAAWLWARVRVLGVLSCGAGALVVTAWLRLRLPGQAHLVAQVMRPHLLPRAGGERGC